ncbi:MAG: isopenicillin N synthase family oxygenase [Neisseriales bacterium]|nr:MAG: isopenicillin N synthase family oxygenase [Neisseriales bacterium]
MSKQLKALPLIDARELLDNKIAPRNFVELIKKDKFICLYNLDKTPIEISAELFRNLELCANKFFELPQVQKMRYYIGNSYNHRGYVPVTEKGSYSDEEGRLYEAFDLSYELEGYIPDEEFNLKGVNQWPNEIKEFKKICLEYYSKLFKLGKALLAIFAEGLGIEANYFDRCITSPPAQLRLINYLINSDMKNQKIGMSMGAHTDYECFTLLYQTSPGLQLFDGEAFCDVPVMRNSLILLPGDIIHYLTNGYICSTPHRVLHNGTYRTSFPFFMNLDFETELSIHEKYLEVNDELKRRTLLPKNLVVGKHLVNQLYRDFPYLRKKIANNEIKVNFELRDNSLFENI